ncbi:MAG: hypothetical protein AB7G75_08235 [Candidatus Binatia bacterium]
MAQLTPTEFDDLIVKLVDYLGLDQFHAKLLKANALVSRKRPANARMLSTQLYQLSAGLRREHPARYAVEVLWQDMLSKSVDEEQNKTVEALIEKVNTSLTPKFEIIPEKTDDLLTALGDYHYTLAQLTNSDVAYMEMLLRATSDVARFLRERRTDIINIGVKRASEQPIATEKSQPPASLSEAETQERTE